jgi:hypothetical protein
MLVLGRDIGLDILTGRLELAVMQTVVPTVDCARGKARLRRAVVADPPGCWLLLERKISHESPAMG